MGNDRIITSGGQPPHKTELYGRFNKKLIKLAKKYFEY